MADLHRPSIVEQDVDQAITALKKGACLLKYGRRGKPKFCPFRLSAYGKDEKQLELRHVTKIIPGQRTMKEMAARVPIEQDLDTNKQMVNIDTKRPSKGSNRVTSSLNNVSSNDTSTNPILSNKTKRQAQKTERTIQEEAGVYITLISFPNGVNELPRVRFSRKRFTEEQAEKWWSENVTRVCQRHKIQNVH